MDHTNFQIIGIESNGQFIGIENAILEGILLFCCAVLTCMR